MNEIIKNFFSNRRNFLLVLAGAGLAFGAIFWFVWGGTSTIDVGRSFAIRSRDGAPDPICSNDMCWCPDSNNWSYNSGSGTCVRWSPPAASNNPDYPNDPDSYDSDPTQSIYRTPRDPGGRGATSSPTPIAQCVLPQSSWTCEDGDCDNDGYLNPAAPIIQRLTVEFPEGCKDPADDNTCVKGALPIAQCNAILATIPRTTPTPSQGGGTPQMSVRPSSAPRSGTGTTPSPATLTVRCSGNQAILSWNIPANSNSNSIQKKLVTGNSWQFIMADTGLKRTTYTDTFNAPTLYRQKSGANVASNVVRCSTDIAMTPIPSGQIQPLSCEPTDQTVETNEIARVVAIGGTGTYHWDITGSGVAAEGGRETIGVQYSVYGEKVLRVSSGGLTAACAITVNAPVAYMTPTPSISLTPSPSNIFAFATPIPVNQTDINNPSNISVGPGGAVFLAMAIASFISLIYASYTRSPAFYRRDAKKIGKARNPLDFRI